MDTWPEDGKNLEMKAKTKAEFNSLIIGCGKIAGKFDTLKSKSIYSHAKAYKINRNINLSCVVDLNLSDAKSLAKKFNVPNFSSDYILAINTYNPHVVSICTPDRTHFDICSAVLKNKKKLDNLKVIFLEKPCCQTLDELEDLIHLSKKRKVEIVVNHSRRFESKHIILKEMIAKKKFGELIYANCFYYSGLLHNGVHTIDTLRFLLDENFKLDKVVRYYKSKYKNDDTVDAFLKTKKKNVPVLLTSIDESYYQVFEFDLFFENARIKIEDFGSSIAIFQKIINNARENVIPVKPIFIKSNEITPITEAVSEIVFYLANKSNRLSECNILSAKKTMQTIWSIQNELK